jgi:hypothetical protein
MTMYKELFRQVFGFISRPGKAWRELAQKEEKGDEFLVGFVYPLIGLVTAAAFLSILFTEKEFHTERAIKEAIKALVSSFGGFFLAAYLLNELWKGGFKRGDNLRLCQRFVGYASVAMFSIHIVFFLLPLLPLSEFFILRVAILFVATLYIVGEGAVVYMGIGEKMRIKFALMVSTLIVLMPEIIRWLLFMLMPGLRV